MRRLIILSVFLATCLVGVTAEPPPAANLAPPADEERISVDFPNEEITSIIRNVADIYELNLAMPQDFRGRKISLKMRNATWQQIFHEALAPVGCTFVVDGTIVRIVSLSALSGEADSQYADDLEEAETAGCVPRSLYWFALPFGLIHLSLAIGLLRDRIPSPARFAPKYVWACAVVLGGIAPLSIYWLIHHSSLAKTDSGGVPPKLS